MSRFTSLLRDEKGAAAVIVALMITVLLGLAALVIDVGYLYEIRRQLQSAADAAALAACQEMVLKASDPNVMALSADVAQEYATRKNTAENANPTIDLTDRSVTVTTSRKANLFFAKVFGTSEKTVHATAKAKVAYLVGTKKMIPLGIPVPSAGFSYEQPYTLFIGNGPGVTGNHYGLRLKYEDPSSGSIVMDSGNGAATFEKGISGDYSATLYNLGDIVETKPGRMEGPITDGINDRLQGDTCTWDAWKRDATTHSNKYQCKRLVVIPLLEGLGSGTTNVKIVGFGQFFIDNPPFDANGDLTGRFIEHVKSGKLGTTPPPGPSIKVIHLVKPDNEN